jgi:hypothetical protein
MSANSESQRSWMDVLALFFSFLAAIVSLSGAIFTYATQAQIPEATLWPLPGFLLVDWLFIGIISFVVVSISLRRKTVGWLRLTWLLTGAFIPLIILGVVSIGLMVLIAFFFAVISTSIIAIRYRFKWLESFGILMLGSISNLLLLILITSLLVSSQA